MKQYLDQ
jgi:hypothetical protein